MSEVRVGSCDNCGDPIVVDARTTLDRVHHSMDPDEPREAMGGNVYCDKQCQGLAQGWLDVK